MSKRFDGDLPLVYEYRKSRYKLHLDDKVLTSWNGLMIAAMCHLYRVTGDKTYLDAAVKAQKFIEDHLWDNDTLYVSWRETGQEENRRGPKGFLDDYANEILALLALYGATLDRSYLEKGERLCNRVIGQFYDGDDSGQWENENGTGGSETCSSEAGSSWEGGFFLYGKDNEQLILRPKETYDGAIFSGNSAMAYNLVQLSVLTGEKRLRNWRNVRLVL